MEENKFKTKDEVLVRDIDAEQWTYAIFSHYNNVENTNYPYVTSGRGQFAQCILYKGNEHLVGTTNKPKEDLPIDTPVMCYNRETEEWILMYYAGHNFTFCKGKSSEGNSQCTWSIIIPVDNFDFDNPKNSLKYNIVNND